MSWWCVFDLLQWYVSTTLFASSRNRRKSSAMDNGEDMTTSAGKEEDMALGTTFLL